MMPRGGEEGLDSGAEDQIGKVRAHAQNAAKVSDAGLGTAHDRRTGCSAVASPDLHASTPAAAKSCARPSLLLTTAEVPAARVPRRSQVETQSWPDLSKLLGEGRPRGHCACRRQVGSRTPERHLQDRAEPGRRRQKRLCVGPLGGSGTLCTCSWDGLGAGKQLAGQGWSC